MKQRLLENGYISVKNCKHGLFAYHLTDTFIGRSLDLYGEWCEFEIDVIRNFVRPGSIVVDAGANIGTHTVALSRLVGRNGRVHAFEPQPSVFHLLCANLALNGLLNVSARQEAAWSENGTVKLGHLPPSSSYYNFGLGTVSPGDGVTATTIDSLSLSDCDLIKIDVEGSEAAVIAGALETINTCQPALYIENNGEDSKAIAPILEQIDYRAFWSIGPYFNPQNHFRNEMNAWPNVMPSANLIALPAHIEIKFNSPMPEFIGAEDNWRKAMERQSNA